MAGRLIAATILVGLAGLGLGQGAAGAAEDPASMRFEWVREGPAEVCGDKCREWVAATGPITPDTIRDFDFFSEARDLRGATIVLDSGGGSVLASLDLGRRMRDLRMTTSVGRTDKLPTANGAEQRAKLSPRGECASMCVFVLLGGTQRQVPAEARIMVHQIWPGGKRYDASAETYTAEEMVRIQRDVGRIARYTVEMGGDIELFELAMRIPPWERLRALSQPELRRMRLQTLDNVADAPTSGALAAPPRPKAVKAAQASQRGWALVERAKLRVLERKHPLTLEGDEIGRFELSLACADGEDGYRLAYQETRAAERSQEPGNRLKDISLWIDGERAPLAIESSGPDGAPGEILSRASGIIPAALVEKLRQDATVAIIVGTKTTNNVRTNIRLGGVGFAKAFPQMAADCRQQAHASADPRR